MTTKPPNPTPDDDDDNDGSNFEKRKIVCWSIFADCNHRRCDRLHQKKEDSFELK